MFIFYSINRGRFILEKNKKFSYNTNKRLQYKKHSRICSKQSDQHINSITVKCCSQCNII
ncbi:hypothetical protein DW049_08240 [Ruminococcus sp. AF41-9]|nr:hypothetical protein DW049_08240 [Ruminococcus sp. AF41-9]